MRTPEALQETLAAEHAAVHVYSVIGAKLGADGTPLADRLRAAYVMHRARRDHLRSRVADSGAEPVGAAAGYDVDTSSLTPAHLQGVARATEESCASVYAQLVASSSGETRRWAVDALVDTGVRLLDLGGRPTAYPGLGELA
jgi:hypothetical protein